jgi:hypothetical protein
MLFGRSRGVKILPSASLLRLASGDADAIPQPIKSPMLMIIEQLYDKRDDDDDAGNITIPATARWLLGPYRIEPI